MQKAKRFLVELQRVIRRFPRKKQSEDRGDRRADCAYCYPAIDPIGASPWLLGFSAAVLFVAFFWLVTLGYDWGIRRDDVSHWFLLGCVFFGGGCLCCLGGLHLGLKGCLRLLDRKKQRERKYFHNQRLNQRVSLDKPENLT